MFLICSLYIQRDYLEKNLDDNRKNPQQMWKILKQSVKGNHDATREVKEIQYKTRKIYEI